MFTGIIETLGVVTHIQGDLDNLHITVQSDISNELKIDQSVSHNGVCLTVISKDKDVHTVTAIAETLKKTNLGAIKLGDMLNLERCVQMNGRLDGHIVQGHIDQVGNCITRYETDGSWEYTFEYDASYGNITVEKGSICINGVSLTVINSQPGQFSVAIIPYTYNHTNFQNVIPGQLVNLEFDIIGKYVARLMTGKN